jgi:hypothetical protein
MKMMQAGSKEAIAYELFHFVDEILHAFKWLDMFDLRIRFCYWAHRYDGNDEHTKLSKRILLRMVKRAKKSGQWGRLPPLGSMK